MARVDPDRQLQMLRATNDSVIKLNHVVHHGALGHHVQNWYAYRGASRIGMRRAVTCSAAAITSRTENPRPVPRFTAVVAPPRCR